MAVIFKLKFICNLPFCIDIYICRYRWAQLISFPLLPATKVNINNMAMRTRGERSYPYSFLKIDTYSVLTQIH